jgi:hypothetical protein
MVTGSQSVSPRGLKRVEKPYLGECTCGASIARWSNGAVVNMVKGVVTTEIHTCAGVTVRPTNTSDALTADVTARPTNTCADDSGDKLEMQPCA